MNVTIRGRARQYRTVAFDAARNSVLLIEQRLLPHEFKVVATADYHETARAITDMVVRGAGAIGATAAYGLAQGARAFRGRNIEAFSRHVESVRQTLKDARPTAVDPVNAMNEVCRAMASRRKRRRAIIPCAGRGGGIRKSGRAPLRGNWPARRQADPTWHEGFDALQRRLAGVCGHRLRHCADVRGAKKGREVPCLLR